MPISRPDGVCVCVCAVSCRVCVTDRTRWKWRDMGGATGCQPAWTGVRYRKLAHHKPTDGCWSFSCSGCGSVQMLQVNPAPTGHLLSARNIYKFNILLKYETFQIVYNNNIISAGDSPPLPANGIWNFRYSHDVIIRYSRTKCVHLIFCSNDNTFDSYIFVFYFHFRIAPEFRRGQCVGRFFQIVKTIFDKLLKSRSLHLYDLCVRRCFYFIRRLYSYCMYIYIYTTTAGREI